MEIRDFLLLAYVAFGNRVQGKTTLQKKVFFLAAKLGESWWKQFLAYEPHYYGPYSPLVENANSELKALGYLRETVIHVGVQDQHGFDVARHDFELTEDGRVAAERKKAELGADWTKIERAARSIEEAGPLGYTELAIAAKTYYVLNRKGGRADYDEIIKAVQELGWPVTKEGLKQAKQFLEKIQLVKSGS